MKKIFMLLAVVLLIVITGCSSDSVPASNDYISANIGTLKYVPAGSFQRDATLANISTVISWFRMSQYEITRAQFLDIMGTDPSDTGHSIGISDPVQHIDWYHAIAFCNKLSIAEGLDQVYSVSGVDFATLTYADIPTVMTPIGMMLTPTGPLTVIACRRRWNGCGRPWAPPAVPVIQAQRI
jgi:hypothetical protein